MRIFKVIFRLESQGMDVKITMKDIVEKVNLSINAVSLVLSNNAGVGDEARALVLKKCR